MKRSAASSHFVELAVSLLARGLAVRFRASGGSMWPAIPDGSLVVVEPSRSVAVGDVALYRSRGGLRAHRVLALCSDGIVTCGDARSSGGVLIEAERVVGRVVAVEPCGSVRRLLRAVLRRIAALRRRKS